MTISRRTFLSGLTALFGVSSADVLTRTIQQAGMPILLPLRTVEKTLHVLRDGTILMNGSSLGGTRPTWRELLAEEGCAVNDPVQLQRVLAERSMYEDELDEQISDVCWPMAYETTWSPTGRAVRLLERLKIGPKLTAAGKGIGQLSFHYGDNHPGSCDVWVNARDDLSVSLLQARLIELNQPIKIIMEARSIERSL